MTMKMENLVVYRVVFVVKKYFGHQQRDKRECLDLDIINVSKITIFCSFYAKTQIFKLLTKE